MSIQNSMKDIERNLTEVKEILDKNHSNPRFYASEDHYNELVLKLIQKYDHQIQELEWKKFNEGTSSNLRKKLKKVYQRREHLLGFLR